MGFSAKQVQALRRQPSSRHIRARAVDGRELVYLEGWYSISQANRIFGFDGWSRETIDSRCVLARENRGNYLAVYIARVRVTVVADGTTIIREGHGTGQGRGASPGEVHDVALKAAETDATKRALATFGKPFGLELYRGGRAADAQKPFPSPQPSPSIAPPVDARRGFHPDDTTPIPRPSTYYGRREGPSTAELLQDAGRDPKHQSAMAAPLVPVAPSSLPNRIDKSAPAIAAPKRLRDKAHLKFVASQACLVCGRQPCDPHHLRFAQPTAMGMKVSDEFTVPLCRGHHQRLHRIGDETVWWENLKIDALQVAKELWEQTHPKAAAEPPIESRAANETIAKDRR